MAQLKIRKILPLVYKTNPYSIQNINRWLILNNKSFKLLSEKYETAHKYLQWKCLKKSCGETFKATWNNISSNSGCSYCAGHKVGLSNCLATKNPKLIKEWHPTLNGDLTPYDVTASCGKSVWWKCNKCGYIWYTTILSRNQGRGCSQCAESKGENKCRDWLIDNNIIYKREYIFDDLKDKDFLRFDFAVFNNIEQTDLKCLIEYDGEGHYSELPFGKKSYLILIKHDKMKNKYCQNNNIPLLRIPYWDFNNIEEILSNYIKITV